MMMTSVTFNPFSPSHQNKVLANIVDPNETAHNDIHWFPFCCDVLLRLLFRKNVLTNFKDGRVQVRNLGMKKTKNKINLKTMRNYLF